MSRPLQEVTETITVLAVDMLVNDTLIDTRSNVEDALDTEVGGNGYGWFTMIETDHVNIDNITLTR